MKFGAEPKKVAVLGVLGLVLAYVVWDNLINTGTPVAPTATPALPPPNIAAVPQPGVALPSGGPNAERKGADVSRGRRKTGGVAPFSPSMLPKRGPNGEMIRPDPLTVDPQLKLDVLAQLQRVNYTGPGRNVFEFGAAPPPAPTTPDPKIRVDAPPKPAIIATNHGRRIGPDKDPPPPPPPPPPPQAPPIALKFYGYVGPRGAGKRAFFLDGEEIFVAGEGDIIKQRYRVVRIGLSSVEMMDVQFPQSKPQQIPLTEEQPGG